MPENTSSSFRSRGTSGDLDRRELLGDQENGYHARLLDAYEQGEEASVETYLEKELPSLAEHLLTELVETPLAVNELTNIVHLAEECLSYGMTPERVIRIVCPLHPELPENDVLDFSERVAIARVDLTFFLLLKRRRMTG